MYHPFKNHTQSRKCTFSALTNAHFDIQNRIARGPQKTPPGCASENTQRRLHVQYLCLLSSDIIPFEQWARILAGG